MGIFSFFKKNDAKKASLTDEQETLRKKRDEDAARLATTTEMGRQNSQQQREIARATALKIDAIESEMAFDIFNEPEPSWTARPKRTPPPPERKEISDGRTLGGLGHTLPMIELATTEILNDSPGTATATVDSAPLPEIEEIAILYASEQNEVVEQMLHGMIREDKLGPAIHRIWWMLFDFYQMTGKQDQFDSLSIDYASKFETSPPSWVMNLHALSISPTAAGVIPTIAFAGILDDSIVKHLEKVQRLSDKNRVFRFEFARITAVNPDGCTLLLRALKTLQKSEHDLIMVGANELADKIRAIVQIGRRDEIESPWLLLLEILQLLNREKDFEETSMDYCITYEVSPPAFEAPKNIKVSMALEEKIHPNVSPDRFLMPVTVTGSIETLLTSIKEYATEYNPVVIDCSRLIRIDFTSAGQLMAGLSPLTIGGRRIEFQDVNHLVAALLNVMGLNQIAKIFPHKY